MLQADVSQLLEHIGETQTIDMPYDIVLSGDDYKVISPVQLHLVLLSTGNDSVLVQGTVMGTLEATCSRCLTGFRKDLTVKIEEEYKKTEVLMSATVADQKLGEEDFVYTIDGAGNIDLAEAVRQNIVVNMPLRFVCREDCQGLTFKDKEDADPRLGKLKELKK